MGQERMRVGREIERESGARERESAAKERVCCKGTGRVGLERERVGNM